MKRPTTVTPCGKCRTRLAAGPITVLSRLSAEFLDRLEKHLKGWGAELAYAAVFGSAATGRMTLDSDIDLFLVRAPGANGGEGRQWEERSAELARSVAA